MAKTFINSEMSETNETCILLFYYLIYLNMGKHDKKINKKATNVPL